MISAAKFFIYRQLTSLQSLSESLEHISLEHIYVTRFYETHERLSSETIGILNTLFSHMVE